MTDPYVCHIWIHIYHQYIPFMLASIYHTYGSYGYIYELLSQTNIFTFLFTVASNDGSWVPNNKKMRSGQDLAFLWSDVDSLADSWPRISRSFGLNPNHLRNVPRYFWAIMLFPSPSTNEHDNPNIMCVLHYTAPFSYFWGALGIYPVGVPPVIIHFERWGFSMK